VRDIADALDPAKSSSDRIKRLYSIKGREVQGISEFFREDDVFIGVVGDDDLPSSQVREILNEVYPDSPYVNTLMRKWYRVKRRKTFGKGTARSDVSTTENSIQETGRDEGLAAQSTDRLESRRVSATARPDPIPASHATGDAALKEPADCESNAFTQAFESSPRSKIPRARRHSRTTQPSVNVNADVWGDVSSDRGRNQDRVYALGERPRMDMRLKPLTDAKVVTPAHLEHQTESGVRFGPKDEGSPFKGAPLPSLRENSPALSPGRISVADALPIEDIGIDDYNDEEPDDTANVNVVVVETPAVSDSPTKPDETQTETRVFSPVSSPVPSYVFSPVLAHASPRSPSAKIRLASPSNKENVDLIEAFDNVASKDAVSPSRSVAVDVGKVSPAKNGGVTPSQSPAKSPVKSPKQEPVATPTQSPAKSPEQEPSATPTQSPAKSPEHTVKSPDLPGMDRARRPEMKINRSKSIVYKTKLERQISSTGRIMERFDLGPILGDGNFAVVKLCSEKTGEGREYALKVIDKSKLRGKEQMIENEIAIMKACTHPNIVRLLEEYETRTEIYLIMELVRVTHFIVSFMALMTKISNQ